MKALVLAASLLVVTPSAFAQDGPSANRDQGIDATPSDTSHSGESNASGGRLVCRTSTTSSTSRMAPRRVCRTAVEWRESARQSRD
ncbi:MAG TPA: hypothetical protein VEX35_00110 [Allosphingosinicella sp.]|nr:hypothetical protein [Allosphingosinicella sp.]